MEINVKKVFLASSDKFENCYIFSPSIGRKKNVGGKPIMSKDILTVIEILKRL